ncbi:MFS transporter [Azospira restricta]|uniref:MFS transporter n=1 Tax=Azospira restricta TaxID=404405 RepID=A0A974SSD0_9RHOO|nr:MFS transporter [Azospira restricta]QRJ65557.1 MFS transporter [Azospira restricta]
MNVPRQRLPRVVVVLGLVSFCNDLASEMVTPLIPILLAAVLGAGPLALGLVEGVAEAVASWLKLWAGRRSDLWGGRRKPFVLAGYFLSNLVRPLLGVAGSWGAVVLLRGVDRVGKGLRTAPRDALVADATPPALRGRAYGLHRALDNGGAMGGALLAAACLSWSDLSLPQIILLSALPGFAGVALVAFAVRDHAAAGAPDARPDAGAGAGRQATPPPLAWRLLDPRLRRYFLVLALFALARASETFIVLRGHELAMSVPMLLLLWAAMSFAKAVTAWFGGRFGDRVGHGRVVLLHWLAHGLAFQLLAFVDSPATLWAAALVFGICAGIGEGAERALVGEIGNANERGTAFGWYNMTLGLAAIPAGLFFGGVWAAFGAAAAFLSGGALALLAAVLLRTAVLARR